MGSLGETLPFLLMFLICFCRSGWSRESGVLLVILVYGYAPYHAHLIGVSF